MYKDIDISCYLTDPYQYGKNLDPDEIPMIENGEYVKVCNGTEWIWCEVLAIRDGIVTGKITSNVCSPDSRFYEGNIINFVSMMIFEWSGTRNGIPDKSRTTGKRKYNDMEPNE
ncbi:hypothetical protein TetV_111 [Tetraselmis virus 1]|uniref:Uncharacterized protein n=1 Tax=Tetraselmis virus 1 TaxID=2060617 RepID=A0A2P0VMU1_9VIRU|nr:hypothetical protein QJ968_gp111 [Tetraselmis virus 1]AUF82203.1 hypothetical protein TetV_111 [Tetraselmis virus 1]